MSSAWSGLVAALRRAWPVLVAYGLFSLWGAGCLIASLVLGSGGFGVSPGAFGTLFGILLATAVGHLLGNLLGLARLRLAVVAAVFGLALLGATLSGVLVGAFAAFLIVGVLAALGGYLGVASRLDVVASWFPLGFAVGGAVIWMNRHNAIETFQTGSKHAVWDPFALVCLGGAVFFNLVFLATRHSLALTVWQEVGRPAARAATTSEGVGVAKPGRGSLLVLLGFSALVLTATALVSPYLFRTARGEQGETRTQETSKDPGTDKGKETGKKKGKGKSSDGDGSGSGSGKGKRAGAGDGEGKGAGDGDGEGKGKGAGDGDGEGKGKGAGDGDGDDEAKSKDPGGSSEPGSDDGSGDPLGKPDPEHASESGGAALAMGMRIMAWLVGIVLALLLALAIVFPPMSRAFLLRHLERPIWPVSRTTRVINLWRRALAALAVVEVLPAAGEAPSTFARRATEDLAKNLGCDAPGLVEAGAIVERVDYAGRGLAPGDEATMRVAVGALVQAIGARAGAKRKLVAAWGPAPDVES